MGSHEPTIEEYRTATPPGLTVTVEVTVPMLCPLPAIVSAFDRHCPTVTITCGSLSTGFAGRLSVPSARDPGSQSIVVEPTAGRREPPEVWLPENVEPISSACVESITVRGKSPSAALTPPTPETL
jgi:hypothetical protein